MILSSSGIVIHTTKYGDTSVIAKVFTREMGMQSFLIPGVRSKSGAIKPSHLMPLNLLELVMIYKQSASLQRIKELRCTPVLNDIHYSMTKTGIALFLKEVIGVSIREEEKNEALFDFLWGSIQILDLQEGRLANFPLHFLIQLSRYLGFYPDASSYQKSYLFDLNEGQFYHPDKAPLNTINESQSSLIFQLLNKDFESVQDLKINGKERQETLEQILNYYRMHLHFFKQIKSPEILREILQAAN